MPSTARQLRQPPTIEAIGRVPYFADVAKKIANLWSIINLIKPSYRLFSKEYKLYSKRIR